MNASKMNAIRIGVAILHLFTVMDLAKSTLPATQLMNELLYMAMTS